MKSYSELLKSVAPFGGLQTVGRTVLGYGIPLIKKGNGAGGLLLIGGVHAREYITSYLLIELMRDYDGSYPVSCVPCLNIDGVLLSRGGVRPTTELLKINGGEDFSLWKANYNAVDLNVNFDAGFGTGRSNLTRPAPESYIGKYPFSEPETRAVRELLKNRYSAVVCYHSKGEEVYYGFGDDISYRTEAERVAAYLGYKAKESRGSAGGIKDYVTLSGGFGITVEVGEDSVPHPYPISLLKPLTEKHTGSVELLCEIGAAIDGRKIYA